MSVRSPRLGVRGMLLSVWGVAGIVGGRGRISMFAGSCALRDLSEQNQCKINSVSHAYSMTHTHTHTHTRTHAHTQHIRSIHTQNTRANAHTHPPPPTHTHRKNHSHPTPFSLYLTNTNIQTSLDLTNLPMGLLPSFVESALHPCFRKL